jgi:peptidoglycan/LPS O-acetylase OafA/YrhL
MKKFLKPLTLVTHPQTAYLTGLRAYAALAVFFIHSGGWGFRYLGKYGNRFVDHGKFGVIAFFVLSAFTISLSQSVSKNPSLKNYWLKRFFRIIPLYFSVLMFFFFLGGQASYLQQFGVENDWKNLFYHFSFLSLWDIRYTSTIIGVEWSIPIEFLSYAYFPAAIAFFKRMDFKAGLITLVSLIVYTHLIHWPLIIHFYGDQAHLAFHWSVSRYFFSFCLGLFVHRHWDCLYGWVSRWNSGATFMFLLGLPLVIKLNRWPEEMHSVWIAFFIVLLARRDLWSRRFFENPMIIFFGNVSFSFYLLHYPILTYFFATSWPEIMTVPLSLILTLCVSALTFLLIERPSIQMGRRLLDQ